MSDVRPITRAASADMRTPPIVVARFVSPAAWLCTICTAYGELLPFKFAPAPAAHRALADERIGWAGADFADVLTNIALFVPVGLLLALHFARGARNWFAPIVVAVTIGAVFATLLEMAQAHLPVRVSSAADVLNNVLGLCIGAVAAPLLHARWPAWRDALALRVAVCPHHVLWRGALAATLFAALAPFDLIPALDRIAAGLAAARWWPFTGSPPAEPAAVTELLRTVLLHSGWAAGLAFLGFRAGRERALSRSAAAALTLRRLVPFFVTLEAAQVLSAHHTLEALDALLAVGGTLVGIGLAGWLETRAGLSASTSARASHLRGVCLAVLIGMVLYQMLELLPRLAGGLAPASTLPDAGEVARTWQLPFVAAFYRPIHLALIDLTLEFARFSLVAAAAWVAFSPRESRTWCAPLSCGVVSISVLLALAGSVTHGGCLDLTPPAIAAAAAPLSLLTIRGWAGLRRHGGFLLAGGSAATAA